MIRHARTDAEFIRRWMTPDQGEHTPNVGISSWALVRFIYGGKRPTKWDYPSDPSDLARCERVWRMVPLSLWTARVASLYKAYWTHVKERYPDVKEVSENDGQ